MFVIRLLLLEVALSRIKPQWALSQMAPTSLIHEHDKHTRRVIVVGVLLYDYAATNT